MQDHKIILITGASSGFGKSLAEKLLEKGHTVYVAARRIELMRDLETNGAHILKMDVTQNDTVMTGVKQIIQEQGRIDILYNNAGFATYGMVENVPLDEIEYQFNVNVFGVARVLQAVLPQMRKQRKGRIINTASIVSNISTMGLGWYAASKHAIKAISVALRQELKEFGIKVIQIQPGAIKTGFEAVAMGSIDHITPPEDYRKLHQAFSNYAANMYKKAPGPKKVIKAMLKAGLSKHPKRVYRTPLEAKVFPILDNLMPRSIYDAIVLKQMFSA